MEANKDKRIKIGDKDDVGELIIGTSAVPGYLLSYIWRRKH